MRRGRCKLSVQKAATFWYARSLALYMTRENLRNSLSSRSTLKALRRIYSKLIRIGFRKQPQSSSNRTIGCFLGRVQVLICSRPYSDNVSRLWSVERTYCSCLCRNLCARRDDESINFTEILVFVLAAWRRP